jgi:DNA-binding PadR family transcriptional regulator
MAARRRVGNLLALAILAGLIERPMHPYEMATLLRERAKDQSIKIQWGSLYTVVQNLEKHGLVAAAGTDRQGRRPERTIYAITPEGRAELDDWMSELVATPKQEFTAFEAALAHLGVLPPDVAISLLRQRIDTLDTLVRDGWAELRAVAETVPRPFLIESEYKLAMAEAEATWVRSLHKELAEGTMPGIELWRQYHELTKEEGQQ